MALVIIGIKHNVLHVLMSVMTLQFSLQLILLLELAQVMVFYLISLIHIIHKELML
jgi:hypothetical protein